MAPRRWLRSHIQVPNALIGSKQSLMISGTFPGQPREDPDCVFYPFQADGKREEEHSGSLGAPFQPYEATRETL